MKLVINDPKTGKSYSLEKDIDIFLNKKLGEVVDGSIIGLDGFKLEITGGSDNSGFPMKKGLHFPYKIKVLGSSGVGFKSIKKGEKKRKTLRGEIVSSDIAQLNLKIIEYGNKNIEELLSQKADNSN